jgi:hypothetical protein
MSITKLNPRTVHLGGRITNVNDLVTSEAVTPGHLAERFNSSGTMKVRKHATAGGFTTKFVALNQPEMNKGIDDAYAAADLFSGAVLEPGATAYMLIASGQNVTQGTFLESAGDGTLRNFGAGTRLFMANETVDNSAGLTPARIRVEAV